MTTRNVLSAGLLSLVLAAAPLASALAQGQPGDPPGRVGRLAEVSGTVSFHGSDQTQWSPASINYPVTGGNAFWTEPRSHAAIDVGASRLYLDSATELDVANVDDQSFTASLAQGAIYLRVSPEANGDQYEIDTPRGAVHIVRAGDYEVIAGDQDHPTTVMAFNGGVAEIVGPNIDASVNPNQAIYVSGQDQYQVDQGNAQEDDFIAFVQSKEQPYQNQNAGPPPNYVSPQMTGYQDLNRYGQWNQDPSYGQVWYPQVAADWAPYRNGHWAYVSPWGWTWIDDAPWGFTPFHYGRWVQVHNRWAWWPGRREARPVYAPALVTFFGNIGGVNLALNIGGGQQNVGWIPLAPDEVYVPPYRHSPTYVRNVNITYVRNETTIINVVNNKTVINNYNNFHNQNGATIVNASTMEASRPVAQDFHKVAPTGHIDTKQLTGVKITEGNVPVKPTNDTHGTTFKGSQPVATGPVVTTNNNGEIQKGKLPPLTKNTKYSQEKNGQGNGQNKNVGQNGNGQNLSGQNGNGQNGGQPFINKNLTGQNGNGQNGNGQNGQNLKTTNGAAGTNNGIANGTKLPPLPPSGQEKNKNQGVVGTNNGQNLNGQNLNGQNGQNLNNQGVVGTNNGNGQNGNGQNGQKNANGQGIAKNNNKLPPLQPSGQQKNNQGVVGTNNGQNFNGQDQNGQNGSGQNGGQNFNNKNLTGQNFNGQNGGQNDRKLKNQTIGTNKQPVIVPNQNTNQNTHGQNNNFGQGNGQGQNGQFNQGNQGQFTQGNQKIKNNGQNFTQGGGQNGGQTGGQGNQKFTNQTNNNGQNNGGQNFLKQGNGGPENQKVQKKNDNKKGVIPPLDNNGQPQHKQ